MEAKKPDSGRSLHSTDTPAATWRMGLALQLAAPFACFVFTQVYCRMLGSSAKLPFADPLCRLSRKPIRGNSLAREPRRRPKNKPVGGRK